MAELFFPQLSTGSLIQYPLRRTRSVHTVVNAMEDGSQLAYFDADAGMLTWALSYAGVNHDEMNALQTLFEEASGRLRAFTFIDPTENLLSNVWLQSPLIQAAGSIFTNAGSAPAELAQTLSVPANYQFCFSLTASAAQPGVGAVEVIRRGPNSERREVLSVGERAFTSGNLADSGIGFTIAIALQPGQTLTLSEMQLEAQSTPSPYRSPRTSGAVFANAHFAIDELLWTADGPDSYSVNFQIEAHV